MLTVNIIRTSWMTISDTHPWITFLIDLNRIDYKLWLRLGEAQSKCEHLAGVPLDPELKEEVYSLYLAKGVHATTAIEGNTLTEKQVQQRIKGELELPPSQEYLGKEIDNVVKSCNQILDELLNRGAGDLTVDEIKRFNKVVLNDLELDDGVVPGEIRQFWVGVGRYRGVPPEDCHELLAKMCEWLNADEFKDPEMTIIFGILRAILSHLYIAWIHPFGDGNGRTARLLELRILLSHGVPSAAAHLLSNHYNQTRTEYYRQLDRTSKSKDIIPFVKYAVHGLVDGLKEQLKHVRDQQMRIMWRDNIYTSFKNKSGAANDRKRKLALDISEHGVPVQVKEIRHLTPRIAELYAGKTDRVIFRDLNTLVEMNLLARVRKGYRPKWEEIAAFLPVCIQPVAENSNCTTTGE